MSSSKKLLLLVAVAAFGCMTQAQSSTPATKAPAAPARLLSEVYEWTKLAVVPTENGERRQVLDGATTTLDRLRIHITTLKPGAASGPRPTLHLQEEIFVIKEGQVELTLDDKVQVAGPGSVVFAAARTVSLLRNAGTTPCTYYVIYYYTPLTPKS